MKPDYTPDEQRCDEVYLIAWLVAFGFFVFGTLIGAAVMVAWKAWRA